MITVLWPERLVLSECISASEPAHRVPGRRIERLAPSSSVPFRGGTVQYTGLSARYCCNTYIRIGRGCRRASRVEPKGTLAYCGPCGNKEKSPSQTGHFRWHDRMLQYYELLLSFKCFRWKAICFIPENNAPQIRRASGFWCTTLPDSLLPENFFVMPCCPQTSCSAIIDQNVLTIL